MPWNGKELLWDLGAMTSNIADWSRNVQEALLSEAIAPLVCSS